MSWLSSWLHPEKGYEKGQEQLDKYYQQGQDYLNPYNQFGQNAYGQYSGAMNALLNPAELQNQWMKDYQQSDLSKIGQSDAMQHGLNAASSLGLSGSNTALNALQGGVSRIGAEDRQNYLNDLMQKYMAGTGIAGNIFGQGANAAGQMGQNAMNMGQNSANMQFGKQNAQGDLFGKTVGAGVGALGSAAGMALGGPIGGALATRWNLAGGK